MSTSGRKGHYGVDAPYVPTLMIAGAIACAALGLWSGSHGWWISFLIFALLAAVYLHTTLRGKFVTWRKLFDARAWRGDEDVLDLGCGRGAVLLMAADYVPQGRAIGVDIWSRKDQSGNAMIAAQKNAELEGVADRVQWHTADMPQLPLPDEGFDVVVSSVAIHNIPTRSGRDQAIDEAWRVLRPGGHLLIADISKAEEYRQRLATRGATVTRRDLGWQMWWGAPWMATALVEVCKPDRADKTPA